jgi:hypothetical protein
MEKVWLFGALNYYAVGECTFLFSFCGFLLGDRPVFRCLTGHPPKKTLLGTRCAKFAFKKSETL